MNIVNHGLDYILHRHRLSADLGVLFGERDRADRRVARQHAAAVEAGQSRRRRGLQPVCDARADDRRAAARQQHRQYRRLGAGDRHVHRMVRRGRRALCHRRDDGDGGDFRRGAAEDHRHQCAGPGVAAGRAADEADGVSARTAAHGDRGDRSRADDERWASRSAPTSRYCRRPSGCAARSICCITKARSKSRTATCSAACSICANFRSPT